jgi:hypothetical protein
MLLNTVIEIPFLVCTKDISSIKFLLLPERTHYHRGGAWCAPKTVSKYCIDTLKNLNIPLSKCVAFCGDNTNINFGGVNCNGTSNIFHKLKVEIGKDIEGIGCPAHILHNTVSTAADRLSTDVEAIAVKIFNYFSIYTIRTEKLKDFCEFVNITYKSLQSHSRTRWVFNASSGENFAVVGSL